MQYHQKEYPFYNPNLTRIPMGSLDFAVNYTDMLDQTCVEFLHVHDCYEIYYCISGMHHLMLEGSVHTLTGGSFAVLRPGINHYTVYEPNLLKQYVVFVFEVVRTSKQKSAQAELDFILSALQYFDEHAYFISKDQFSANAIIRKIEEESRSSLPGKTQMVSALYQQYLISIFRHLVSGRYAEPAPSNINLAVAMTKFMHQNYSKNITVRDIADHFYVSPRHISRIFEDYFGQSFKRTLNIYRLNYAKNYLIDTDYSIEKIAELVGFSSPKTLYRLFQDIEGMTVSEFRQIHRAEIKT